MLSCNFCPKTFEESMNGFFEKEFHELNHERPTDDQIVMLNNVEVDQKLLKKLIKDVRMGNG